MIGNEQMHVKTQSFFEGNSCRSDCKLSEFAHPVRLIIDEVSVLSFLEDYRKGPTVALGCLRSSGGRRGLALAWECGVPFRPAVLESTLPLPGALPFPFGCGRRPCTADSIRLTPCPRPIFVPVLHSALDSAASAALLPFLLSISFAFRVGRRACGAGTPSVAYVSHLAVRALSLRAQTDPTCPAVLICSLPLCRPGRQPIMPLRAVSLLPHLAPRSGLSVFA
jgi:hypothetical protein